MCPLQNCTQPITWLSHRDAYLLDCNCSHTFNLLPAEVAVRRHNIWHSLSPPGTTRFTQPNLLSLTLQLCCPINVFKHVTNVFPCFLKSHKSSAVTTCKSWNRTTDLLVMATLCTHSPPHANPGRKWLIQQLIQETGSYFQICQTINILVWQVFFFLATVGTAIWGGEDFKNDCCVFRKQ